MTGRHRGYGIAAGLEKGGRVATCAEVNAEADGDLRVTRIVTAYECGAVVNPDTVRGQIEGGTIMALGGALFEQAVLDHGQIASPSLASWVRHRAHPLDRLVVRHLAANRARRPLGAGEGRL
jgi:nicotinate dehydrogenase subunit B